MNIVEKNRENILYYEFEIFKKLGFINHLFSSIIGWNIENTIYNVSKILNVPESNIISLKQIHSNHIEIMDENLKDYGKITGKEGDGLITNIPNIVLMTYHADCVPIYFVDTKKKVIGLAHGGWRGSFDNISGKMIKTFVSKFDSNPQDLLVTIGPSIGPCCYEISKDLGESFLERYGDFEGIIMERHNKTYLDLWKLNYLQIKKSGVLDKNIISSNLCTSCNINKFHSYRREKGTKDRMVAAINLF